MMLWPEREKISRPLARSLAAFAASVVLPMLLTALALGLTFVMLERGRLEEMASNRASTMAANIDREMNGRIAVLRALSTSPALASRDFELFQRQTENIAQAHGGQIILRDMTGQQLANSAIPWGRVLPKIQADTPARAIETGAALFNFTQTETGAPVLTVSLPVSENGRSYFLDMNVDTETARTLLSPPALPRDWAWGIFDRSSHTITNGGDIGADVFTETLSKVSGDSGTFLARAQDNREILLAVAVAPLTGWQAAVAVSKTGLEEPLTQSLFTLALIAGLIFTFAMIAVTRLNARLRNGTQDLLDATQRFQPPEILNPVKTGVKEFDRVAEALSAASIALREKTLQIFEREERLRVLLDNLFVFVNLLDASGRIVEANLAPLQAAGLTRDDVIGRLLWETYWWNWSPTVQERIREAVETARAGQTVRFQTEMRMAGGALHMIDFKLEPLRARDGSISYLLPSATDISERMDLEQKLQTALAQIEATYAAAPIALFLMDQHLRFLAVNAQAAGMNKRSIAEHLGRTLRDILGDDGKRLETQLRKVLKTGKPIEHFEYTRTPDEGERITRVFSASYWPILSDDNKVQGVAGAVRDITANEASKTP